MSQQYRVRWEIDVEAASPLAAAERALALQRDPRSPATVFQVEDESGRTTTFDLPVRAVAQTLRDAFPNLRSTPDAILLADLLTDKAGSDTPMSFGDSGPRLSGG